MSQILLVQFICYIFLQLTTSKYFNSVFVFWIIDCKLQDCVYINDWFALCALWWLMEATILSQKDST